MNNIEPGTHCKVCIHKYSIENAPPGEKHCCDITAEIIDGYWNPFQYTKNCDYFEKKVMIMTHEQLKSEITIAKITYRNLQHTFKSKIEAKLAWAIYFRLDTLVEIWNTYYTDIEIFRREERPEPPYIWRWPDEEVLRTANK